MVRHQWSRAEVQLVHELVKKHDKKDYASNHQKWDAIAMDLTSRRLRPIDWNGNQVAALSVHPDFSNLEAWPENPNISSFPTNRANQPGSQQATTNLEHNAGNSGQPDPAAQQHSVPSASHPEGRGESDTLPRPNPWTSEELNILVERASVLTPYTELKDKLPGRSAAEIDRQYRLIRLLVARGICLPGPRRPNLHRRATARFTGQRWHGHEDALLWNQCEPTWKTGTQVETKDMVELAKVIKRSYLETGKRIDVLYDMWILIENVKQACKNETAPVLASMGQARRPSIPASFIIKPINPGSALDPFSPQAVARVVSTMKLYNDLWTCYYNSFLRQFVQGRIQWSPEVARQWQKAAKIRAYTKIALKAGFGVGPPLTWANHVYIPVNTVMPSVNTNGNGAAAPPALSTDPDVNSPSGSMASSGN